MLSTVPNSDAFEAFWDATLNAHATHRRAPLLTRVDSPFDGVLIDDAELFGFDGDPIRAWILTPANAAPPRGTVVQFTPYGSGRGWPGESQHWASAGFIHVIVDTRGQGADGASRGATPDPHGSAPSVRGWMTRGIDNPETYFYRRVFTDASMIVDAVRELPRCQGAPLVVTGRSQGGGIAIAAAALTTVDAVLADVPLLQDFPTAIRVATRDPYAELQRYLAQRPEAEERVLRTLSFFDGVVFARRCSAPALFSVGLRDLTCPPETVLASFDAYGSGDKQLETYPYNDHEGGGFGHLLKQIDWLRSRF